MWPPSLHTNPTLTNTTAVLSKHPGKSTKVAPEGVAGECTFPYNTPHTPLLHFGQHAIEQ